MSRPNDQVSAVKASPAAPKPIQSWAWARGEAAVMRRMPCAAATTLRICENGNRCCHWDGTP